MLSARARATSLATILAFAGLGLLAAPAHAANATTINVPDEAFTDEPLQVTGTCAPGSRTAVIAVTQGEDVVDQTSVTLGEGLTFSADLDISQAAFGFAEASVECVRYEDQAPLGVAADGLFILPDIAEVPVTASPERVTIGDTVTVSAECEPGTKEANVLVGNLDGEEPFFDEVLTVPADGSFSLDVDIVPGNGVEPEPGDAGALVLCDVDEAAGIFGKSRAAALAELSEQGRVRAQAFGFGMAEFTIVAAPAAPVAAPVAAAPAAAAVPQLANTGSDPEPLVAIAVAMIAAGAAAIRISRRA